jgi:nucleotide-binding universal stress UspA family protein
LTQVKAVLRGRLYSNGQPESPGPREESAMTYKLLCPVDGTDHSLHAVDAAADLALKYAGDLVICVVNVAHGAGRGPLIHHWSDAEAQGILDKASALAAAKGVTPTATAVVIDREAASGIVGYAEMQKVDHIVMGTGDKRGPSRLVLGSVAADVCGRAHCSVTVAR